ncbi:hypothetical protein AB6A40_008907 [Gnathostoma spinigerum]|uniref:RRM domain-containing protein n=1 Tax=Gnathostoma spinigerum TaxID=75299 RepID=A0ABD6EYP3_9BILA
MMFERALSQIAIPPSSLWYSYGSWADDVLKLPSVAVEIYRRAVKCSPCTALWQKYLTALERANLSSELIDSVWEQAQWYYDSVEDGMALYRTYIYLLRRRADRENGNMDKVDEIFREGAERLEECFGRHWDHKGQYRKNHALFLYTKLKKPAEAQKVWHDILSSGSGHLAAAWIEAANLERFFGSTEMARKILYRGINSASDHPLMVYDALIQFEREEGTLEDLDKALVKVNSQLERLELRNQKIRDVKVEKKNPQKGKGCSVDKSAHENSVSVEDFPASTSVHSSSSLSVPRAPDNDSSKDIVGTKRSLTSEHNGSQPERKRQKPPLVIDASGFAVPALPPVSAKSSRSTDPTQDSKVCNTNGAANDHSMTVFVSNLDFKAPKEALQELFPDAKEIRLASRAGSQLHRGFGYIDFNSPEEAEAALLKDRQLIGGRPVFVSAYEEHQKGTHSSFRYATGLEKCKVFVNNVHYDASAEQVQELFSQFGNVKDVRIVTHKSGKAKGCAYVEFSDEIAASAACKAPGLTLLDRKLSVALSNPPKKTEKKKPINIPQTTMTQRNRLELVPRSVSRSTSDTLSRPSSGGKLSNDQFRQFLKQE